LTTEGKSLIYKVKSKGPRTDPWSTPIETAPNYHETKLFADGQKDNYITSHKMTLESHNNSIWNTKSNDSLYQKLWPDPETQHQYIYLHQ
ncbi:MAG: hypothetical protein OXG81_11360, partial [Acidobacteria bacterium]|nr:hypothetical protein [Acidobacteriota bacterium]